jgi:AraC-like DNA-binding protein
MGRARVFGPADAALVLPGELRALRGAGSPTVVSSGGGSRIVRLSFPAAWAAAGQRAWLVGSLATRSAEERSTLVLGADAFTSLVRKIEGLVSDDGGVSASLRGTLAESLFLDLSLELLRDEGERRGENAPHWLRTACASMESRKNLRAGGERLAELSGKSQEHVIRQMRRYYGMTPTQYINELRLRTASRLLLESDRPVLDIGYSLGFQNPSYFAQLFKEKFGMPPTRFRAVRRR